MTKRLATRYRGETDKGSDGRDNNENDSGAGKRKTTTTTTRGKQR